MTWPDPINFFHANMQFASFLCEKKRYVIAEKSAIFYSAYALLAMQIAVLATPFPSVCVCPSIIPSRFGIVSTPDE